MERLLVCFSLLVLLQTSLAARLHHEHRHVIRTDGSSSVGTAQGHQFHTDVEQSIEDTVESMASDKLFSSADAEALADAITRKLQQEDEYPYKKEDWLRLAQMVFEEAEDRLTAPHYVKEVAARVGAAPGWSLAYHQQQLLRCCPCCQTPCREAGATTLAMNTSTCCCVSPCPARPPLPPRWSSVSLSARLQVTRR